MEAFEDGLIMLFEKIGIETGTVNSNSIKAWFDTDSEDLLMWICKSITAENYLSPQENYSYSRVDNILTDNQLVKEVTSIETEFPDLFEYHENLVEAEYLDDMLEVLVEQDRRCNQQLKINRQLYKSLYQEFSIVSSLEVRLQDQLDILQEDTVRLCKKLDHLYSVVTTKHQNIVDGDPHFNFVNKIEVIQWETQLTDVFKYISDVTSESNLEQTSKNSPVLESISELSKRIYNSKVSCLNLETTVESCMSIKTFMEQYDVKSLIPIRSDALRRNIESLEERQREMLKAMNESFSVSSKQDVNCLILKFQKNEHSFLQKKLDHIKNVNECISKFLSYFMIINYLCEQETQDIECFSTFVEQMREDCQNSLCRETGMQKVIDEYKLFCSKPIESKFELIDFIGIFLTDSKQPLEETVEAHHSLKRDIQTLKQSFLENLRSNLEGLKELLNNSHILKQFLLSGPTHRVVVIPALLQKVLIEINQNIATQTNSLKLVIKAAQKPKSF